MDTQEILVEVKSLSRPARACSFYRVDLHVHSPASADYQGQSDISPYGFISEFVARGFDVIAITDHNTGTYIDQAIEARNQIASTEGKNITILPGVELHVSPGVHLLAILPEGGSEAIKDLLSRLGLPSSQHGDTTKLISEPIGEIRRIVNERKGLLIGAHCNSTKGIVKELSGQARIEWLQALDALEINSESGDDKISKTIDYVRNSLKVVIPFTFGSDSHDAASDATGMWVKMAEPSYTCLRQLSFEPQLRVSRIKPTAHTHGRIIGFTTTQGIYANESFRFSPNLNTLLGGRGAGKSAAIDLLRFAFEAEPRADDIGNEVFTRRIMSFLQSVGEVLVVVVGTDEQTYVVSRSGAYEVPSARARPVFTKPALVYQVAEGDLIPRHTRPLNILGIEFYGQGEVARLADRVDEQLRLIDENLDHSAATASIADAERHLKEHENRLIECKQCLEALRAEAASRPELEGRRTHLAKSLADPVFDERTRWDREKAWIEGQQGWLQGVLNSLPDSILPRTDLPINVEGSSAKPVLEKVLQLSDRIFKGGRADLAGLRSSLEGGLSELAGYRSEWNAAFEAAEERYRARLAELGAANLAEAAAELRRVELELTRIETGVEPRIKQFRSEITTLENGRSKHLAELRDARSRIASSRSSFVEELNAGLGGNVVVDLSGIDMSLYFDAVDSPLRGTGMHSRQQQVSKICESLTPTSFAEIIRTRAKDELTSIGLTDSNASRMLSGLTDNDLYQIERVDIPQRPSIRIKREGEAVHSDLSTLSVGEKCSAILSIVLLSKGKPLVIDQPEDDLDHAFIINSIVEGIRTAKSSRQIIAATHNPNIPVLGDAEMVFRVARKAGYHICQIQISGGLELPRVTAEVQSLEGGAEAFERRRRRYSGVS